MLIKYNLSWTEPDYNETPSLAQTFLQYWEQILENPDFRVPVWKDTCLQRK
jgi:hypothetical protein